MKLSRAVETDNFESAPESYGRNKRKKKVPKRLDDSSSESDTRCLVSSPPKIYQKENKKKIKNSISMDSWSKQKCSKSVEKPSVLQNISCNSMPLKTSAKPNFFISKMKDKQCDISNDSTPSIGIKSSTVVSQMNHPRHDFDDANYKRLSPILSKTDNMEYLDSNLLITPYVKRNRQVCESQLKNYTEKNSQVNGSLPRDAVRFSPFKSSPSHHISSPGHLSVSLNNVKITTTERIQDNSYHLQSLSCQQSYLFNGVKRSLQEIIKNQEEIKAKLRNHNTMLKNVLMLVANDSEQLTKPQGWPDIFPLPNIEAFLKFESFLEKKNNFSFTIKYLALKCYSPNSCEEMTRNICCYIFSTDLKKKFNWRGTSIKNGLKTKRTGSLISDTVLLKYTSSGLHIVTKTISTWLRNNIGSKEQNSGEQNEEENENEYSDD